MAVYGHERDSIPVDNAFGSGKTGITLVAFVGSEVMELNKSYFPHLKAWYLTPGHEKQKATDVGMMYKPDQSLQCVHCHAVTTPDSTLKPDPAFFGVGCESCHGPGSAHVEAMRAGKPLGLSMERLQEWDATRLNTLCARCHRGRDDISMSSEQANQTNRFMPYGLMKSRCFLGSGNRLSCMTCHDPHGDAMTDPKGYEAACLSCHSGRAAATQPVSGNPSAIPTHTTVKDGSLIARSCPVNRRHGCIGCHMPSRVVFPHSKVPTRMADHFIRIHARNH
jgi:nitrate reductase cytochrome c-type subunit